MPLKVDGLRNFPHILPAMGLRTPLKIIRFALEGSSGLAHTAKDVKNRLFRRFWCDLPSSLVKIGSVFASIARKSVVWPANRLFGPQTSFLPRKIGGYYGMFPPILAVFALASPEIPLNPSWNEAQGSLRCRNPLKLCFSVIYGAIFRATSSNGLQVAVDSKPSFLPVFHSGLQKYSLFFCLFLTIACKHRWFTPLPPHVRCTGPSQPSENCQIRAGKTDNAAVPAAFDFAPSRCAGGARYNEKVCCL